MPAHYPRPPIETADLFLAPPTEAWPELPLWWPNDKQLVVSFQPPPLQFASPEDDR